MTFQYQNISIKQENCNDSHYSSQNFWDYELAFNDFQEDASTQTDSFTVFKSEFSAPSTEEALDMAVTTLETHSFHSPPLRTTNHSYKNKSPNTVKVLMEKHRVNERLRHHCLNEQLYMICRIVPGFTEEGKETKVVMMQRIISYIAYLENSIQLLSKELDIDPDSSSHLLTRRVKDMDFSNFWYREYPQVNSEDSRDSQVSTLSISRRLKLSSPENDFTTDCASQDSIAVSNSSVLTRHTDCSQISDISGKIESCGQESNAGDDSNVDFLPSGVEKMEVFTMQDQFDFLLESSSSFDHSVFQVPPSSFEECVIESEASEVEWLGSPDKATKMGKVEHFGIKLDPYLHEEPVHEFSNTDIVSPDQVLPQISMKQERLDSFDIFDSEDNCSDTHGSYFSPFENALETVVPTGDVKLEMYDEEDYQVVPSSIDSSKQLTPRRQPFSDIVNIPTSDYDAFSFVEESAGLMLLRECHRFAIKGSACKVSHELKSLETHRKLLEFENVCCVTLSGIPMASNFMEVESSMEETVKRKEEEQEESLRDALKRIRSKVLEEASLLTATSKLDLRKSSWLNGFMMYSQAHRKKFIRENPGVHTAQISKMMGQAWRDMSSEQQNFYREHAKLCSHELQQVLDKKISSLDRHHSL